MPWVIRNLNTKMFKEIEDFLQYIDVLDEENQEPVPKRYIRDADNPMYPD